jgi:hypothetical protein
MSKQSININGLIYSCADFLKMELSENSHALTIYPLHCKLNTKSINHSPEKANVTSLGK